MSSMLKGELPMNKFARSLPISQFQCLSTKHNRIYNKMLDSDWFSTHLLTTLLEPDHMGVQLRYPVSIFL